MQFGGYQRVRLKKYAKSRVLKIFKSGRYLYFVVNQIKLQMKLRSWKTRKGHEKSHGKSWNLKNSEEYEPCI